MSECCASGSCEMSGTFLREAEQHISKDNTVLNVSALFLALHMLIDIMETHTHRQAHIKAMEKLA